MWISQKSYPQCQKALKNKPKPRFDDQKLSPKMISKSNKVSKVNVRLWSRTFAKTRGGMFGFWKMDMQTHVRQTCKKHAEKIPKSTTVRRLTNAKSCVKWLKKSQKIHDFMGTYVPKNGKICQ